MVSIVLADDHNLVRQAVHSLLEQHGHKVVGEASDGLEAINQTKANKPEVLIVDLMIGTMDGLEVTRHINKAEPDTKIIVLSMYDDENYVVEALRAGAKAYVLKESSSEDLLRAINEVMAGFHFLSPALSERAFEIYARKMPLSVKDPYENLSYREREVLHLMAANHKNSTIAEKLFISRRTVEVHRANIKRKLGISSRADLIRISQNHNTLTLPVHNENDTSKVSAKTA